MKEQSNIMEERASVVKKRFDISWLLNLLAVILPVLIWSWLFIGTPLLAFFFRWPATPISPPLGNFEVENRVLLNTLIFGGLALFWPLLAAIVGHRVQSRRHVGQLASAPLVLVYVFAILAAFLLLVAFCGVWLSTFFYFN